jgi:hypothetical protein
MSEQIEKARPVAPLVAETQQERWLKYGGNVALMTVIVVLLAAAVIFAAEKKTKRLDTTSAGLYSLKPQTINIIKDNAQKIQITSLYTHAKPSQQTAAEAAAEGTSSGEANVADQADKVADLLEEYKSKGKNIQVDTIDPDANPSKIDDLIADVTSRYGGQVDKYKSFAKTYPDKLKKVTDEVAAEGAKITPLVEEMLGSIKKMRAALETAADSNKPPSTDDVNNYNQVASIHNQLTRIARYAASVPAQVQETENLIQRALKTKPPAYKTIADNAKESLGDLSANINSIVEGFTKEKDNAKLPEPVRKYMVDSLPRYQAMKKEADDLSAEATALGELKLDTLRDALRQRNSILVRGDKEWKILAYDQVWRRENRSGVTEAARLKPRFAGEQMITTAIWGLQHPTKLKVAIVRPGGGPLTEPPIPIFGREAGPLWAVAERLRDYNYDVVEKDLTGMFAMQSQGQAPPEPSDAEIRDAVWIVADVPSQQSQFGPSPTISAKVAEHLANGGSALILGMPRADDMSAALKEWGISLKSNLLCVHEQVKSEGAPADMIEQVKKSPRFFEIRDWGTHAITSPMHSLPGIFFEGCPVVVSAAKGVRATQIIPIPDAPYAPKSWAETDLESVRDPKFNPDKGDLAGPLYGGAAAEKEGAGRVVVVGSLSMAVSGVVNFYDPELEKKEIYVIRFPGNGELISNAVYWLSKQETMIAISPASMDVGRIEGLTRASQGFWRVGVLLIGLPLAVIFAGGLVYFARRD